MKVTLSSVGDTTLTISTFDWRTVAVSMIVLVVIIIGLFLASSGKGKSEGEREPIADRG